MLVAKRLGPLRDRVVFVGGMIRGLLVTDPAAGPPRPTDDVDMIVDVPSLHAGCGWRARRRDAHRPWDTDVITDNVTGLRWQRKVTLIDQDETSGQQKCQANPLGGLSSGWRMPTVKELQSLVDVRGTINALDSALELDSSGKLKFISSTTVASDTSMVWTVELGSGCTEPGTIGAGTTAFGTRPGHAPGVPTWGA